MNLAFGINFLVQKIIEPIIADNVKPESGTRAIDR